MTDVLGLGRFGAQGGDRGAFVCAGLGHRHPDSVIGIHLNLATGIVGSGDAMTDQERQFIADQGEWLAEEGGYIAIQGTRPQKHRSGAERLAGRIAGLDHREVAGMERLWRRCRVMFHQGRAR